jgi:excisionase family DNA binding protein
MEHGLLAASAIRYIVYGAIALEVAAMLNVSERTLWRLLSAGKVPQPVRFGRSTRWKAGEVAGWIERGCPVEK